MSEQPPARPPEHWFTRQDESDDRIFYAVPRLVTHIDNETIASLTAFYETFMADGHCVLDLMSSWISHLPEYEFARVAALGMNAEELAQNEQIDEGDWLVQDLNQNPILPYQDATFDRVTIAVSIQYLVQPIAVLTEVRRVLKPAGKICIAMSHRLFPTKAIAAFVNLPPQDRIRLVSFYLMESGFSDVEFVDQSPDGFDPLWLVLGNA